MVWGWGRTGKTEESASARRGDARFGKAQTSHRMEDAALLTGGARFADDVVLPGQLHAAFVRASVGHADIVSVETSAAAGMRGVAAVITGRELVDAGLGPIPPVAVFIGKNGKEMFCANMPAIAATRVRYVGEPVALVVAETLAQAMDAAEAVEVVYAQRPAAVDVPAAMAKDAPQIWDEAPGNIALDWEEGDAAAVDAAFAAAAHVERVRLADTRLAPSALEPRAAIATYEPETQRLTLIAPTQGVAVVRKILAESVFRVPTDKIRILTHDVGGGFGMKVQAYQEYAALLFAARRTGRPVKWCATRLESFLADTHGRDGVLEGELALDANGKFLALRARTYVGIGAYTSTYIAIIATWNTKNCLSSVYKFPAIHFNTNLVLTNAAPLGPYRGAGRPEAIYLIERLIDKAAVALSIDRAELRRRNMIAPADMPYKTPNGPIYDSGEFAAMLDKALASAGWSSFAERRKASERAGKLRGIGICCFLEVAGGILDETVDLRFERDGKVALRTGVQAMGQGHLSTFVPLVAKRLGIDPEAVRLIEGDSDEVPVGTPSVASSSIMMAGSATAIACDRAIEKGKEGAAFLLGVGSDTIDFNDGVYHARGTNHTLPILDVARRLREGSVPEALSGGLDNGAKFVSPQMSFPNGCHVCEVEIDPDTGIVTVVGYTAVDDVGNMLHETIVEGQIHGGIAQGLGQVLGEHVVYSETGELLTASFMDYQMPRAGDLPNFSVHHHVVPCQTNPLGVKGAGESGVAGSLPSGVSAVLDALSTRGVTHLDLPITPQRIWAAVEQARAAR